MDFKMDELKDKAVGFADKASEAAGDLVDKAKLAAPGVKDAAQGVAAMAAEAAGDLVEKDKAAAPDVIDGAKDIAGKAAVAAASAISSAKDFVEEATGKDLDGDGKVGKGE